MKKDKIIYPYACNRCLPERKGNVYRECEEPKKIELFKIYCKPYWCPLKQTAYFWLAELNGSDASYAGPSKRAPWLITADPYSAFRFNTKDECQKWINETVGEGSEDFLPIEHGLD